MISNRRRGKKPTQKQNRSVECCGAGGNSNSGSNSKSNSGSSSSGSSSGNSSDSSSGSSSDSDDASARPDPCFKPFNLKLSDALSRTGADQGSTVSVSPTGDMVLVGYVYQGSGQAQPAAELFHREGGRLSSAWSVPADPSFPRTGGACASCDFGSILVADSDGAGTGRLRVYSFCRPAPVLGEGCVSSGLPQCGPGGVAGCGTGVTGCGTGVTGCGTGDNGSCGGGNGAGNCDGARGLKNCGSGCGNHKAGGGPARATPFLVTELLFPGLDPAAGWFLAGRFSPDGTMATVSAPLPGDGTAGRHSVWLVDVPGGQGPASVAGTVVLAGPAAASYPFRVGGRPHVAVGTGARAGEAAGVSPAALEVYGFGPGERPSLVLRARELLPQAATSVDGAECPAGGGALLAVGTLASVPCPGAPSIALDAPLSSLPCGVQGELRAYAFDGGRLSLVAAQALNASSGSVSLHGSAVCATPTPYSSCSYVTPFWLTPGESSGCPWGRDDGVGRGGCDRHGPGVDSESDSNSDDDDNDDSNDNDNDSNGNEDGNQKDQRCKGAGNGKRKGLTFSLAPFGAAIACPPSASGSAFSADRRWYAVVGPSTFPSVNNIALYRVKTIHQ